MRRNQKKMSNNTPKKKVAIIAVLWKSRQFLPTWFESLAKIDYPRESVDLILIDNFSSDGTQEYVENVLKNPLPGMPRIKYMRQEENLGFAGGNNVGFEYAKANGYDYFYLLNYDTRVDPGFIREAIEAAESDEKIGSVQSLLLLHPEKHLINSSGNMIHYLGFGFCGDGRVPRAERNFSGLPEIAYPSGAGVLLKTEVIEKTGLFDEVLFAYHEDLDLGWNIRLAGYKNVLAPKSIVYHEYEFSRSISKYYWMERNRFIVFFANYKFLTQLLFLPPFIIMELGQIIFSTKSGWWKEKFRAVMWMKAPWHWGYLFKKHFRVSRIRKVKDREILRLYVGKISYQEINNWALRIVNPVFNVYFKIVRSIIFW